MKKIMLPKDKKARAIIKDVERMIAFNEKEGGYISMSTLEEVMAQKYRMSVKELQNLLDMWYLFDADDEN